MQVLTIIRKDIIRIIVIKNQTNLVSHPNCIILDIKELYSQSKKSLYKITIVNI